MVKLDEKMWEGTKVKGYFSIGKTAKVWERILGGTENMGTNNSMAKLLMKMWEGKRKNRDLANEKRVFFL